MKTIQFFIKNFFLCGLTGWCLEIMFTAFDSFRRRELKLKGNTSIWMFPIYGMAVFFAPLYHFFKNKSLAIRGFIYMLCIFVTEFFAGTYLKKFHLCPWDYSRAKLNVKGVIRLDFAPFWFITGLIYEKILKISGKSY